MKDEWQKITGTPARAAALAVRGYQVVLSPALHALTGQAGGCRFYPTCSEYARQALLKHGLVKGSLLSAKRLSKCHPWHPGGIDPVG